MTRLRERLSRHHQSPGFAPWGRKRIWPNPGLASGRLSLKSALLLLSGPHDAGAAGRVRHDGAALWRCKHLFPTRLLEIPECGHAPLLGQPDEDFFLSIHK